MTLLAATIVYGSDEVSRAERVSVTAKPRAELVEAAGHVPTPAPPAMVLVRVFVSDNGDQDGYADSFETVDLFVTVYNRTGLALDNVTAELSTTDPAVGCISLPHIDFGSLADRETRTGTTAFRFMIGDVQRESLEDDLTASFSIAWSATDRPDLGSSPVTLDLDLDVSGGEGPTQFFEGFEGGLDTFLPMPIDEPLNAEDDDLGNHQSGRLNSDGFRCAYNDPDWEGSNSPGRELCYVSPGQPDRFFFEDTTDRAFSGSRSLHWGIFLDEIRGFTEPFGQLEAIGPEQPINIGRGRVCSKTRSLRCAEDLDCPVGEACEGVVPVLLFKHQISQVDHRSISGGPDGRRGVDRAVVQVQVVNNDGEPIGPWINLDPFHNVYDTQDNDQFSNCSFDPIDDGNDESTFFDPEDPARRHGPSSTCFPTRTFVHQGDTFSAFDAQHTGDASDGPGLEGEHGIGTWVESRFDLGRYVGRKIRLRFLESSLELIWVATYEDFTLVNPVGTDDGWFIDDLTVTDTLAVAATATPDVNDNDDLRGDHDLDTVPATCDCAPDDGTTWDLPGNASGLLLSLPSGATGPTRLVWSPPLEGGTEFAFDTLRSTAASAFGDALSTVCLESADTDLEASDATPGPGPGATWFYLVRASNPCGNGPSGTDSANVPRVARACEAS